MGGEKETLDLSNLNVALPAAAAAMKSSVKRLGSRLLKPSVAKTEPRTSGDAPAMNSMHLALSCEHPCCSARVSVVATMAASMPRAILRRQISLSRSSPYLSAATRRC
ncbi:hypothetical protein EJB05_54240, partial [Eragrostis curvula]